MASFVGDLALFPRSPRAFYAKCRRDPRLRLLQRLLTYAVLFDLIALLPLSFYSPRVLELSPWKLFLVGGLELLLALVYAPVLLLANRIARTGAKPRELATHVVVYKFIGALPVLACYAAFLITENYLFVWIRGFFYWLLVLSLPTAWPFFVRRGLRRRIIAAVLSLVLFLALTVSAGYLLTRTAAGRQRIATISLLYDPIAAESESLVDRHHMVDISKIYDIQQALVGSVRHVGDRAFVSTADLRRSVAELKGFGRELDGQSKQELQWTASYVQGAQFQANKDLANLRLPVYQTLSDIAQVLENMSDNDLSRTLTDFITVLNLSKNYLQAFSASQDAVIRTLEQQNLMLKTLVAVW
jgi:hypothetical protein